MYNKHISRKLFQKVYPVIFTFSVLIFSFTFTQSHAQIVHILFDATKGEMAGNADWVIDYDQTTLGVGASGAYLTSSGHQSNPQRYPTPAQSTVTSSTPETYWSGALSSWGIDCANKGYLVETLPWNGQITYGNTSNAQDLSNYQIYIVDEPNIVYTSAQKTAIIQFVQNGGSLFIISDHNNSDRNGDGWDSPNIWNDLFTNNSITTNPFGISFDLLDFSQTSTNVFATSTDSIIHGPMGNVTKVQWSGGTSMTLDPTKNPTIKGVVYTTGSAHGNSNVLVAYGRYGSGKFAAMGDSSPSDDGTGNPTCTLYNGYWSDASGNHRLLLMNITIWLAEKDPSTSVKNTEENNLRCFTAYPNPANGVTNLMIENDMNDVVISATDITGKELIHIHFDHLSKGEIIPMNLIHGYNIIRMCSDKDMQTTGVSVY